MRHTLLTLAILHAYPRRVHPLHTHGSFVAYLGAGGPFDTPNVQVR